MRKNFSRRDVLAGTGAVALGLASTRVVSAAPAASPVTPELIEAAKKEGKVVYYTSVDLPLAEKVAKAFEAKYSGIAVRVERSGAERVFQRIGQEYSSRIYAADVVNSSDAAHFIVWKRDGILAPYVTEDVAKFYPPEHQDADGLYASFRIGLSVIAYNTSLVKAEDAPKSFADLLDPKWAGKICKAHPGYSGTIMTATFQITRDLGWEYLEKLAKQRIMQLQSSADPPKKLALAFAERLMPAMPPAATPWGRTAEAATRRVARVLAPLARAALENALARGPSALTGPAARGDAAAVTRHLAAIDAVEPAVTDAYRAQSRRAAAQSGTSAMIDPVLEKENR